MDFGEGVDDCEALQQVLPWWKQDGPRCLASLGYQGVVCQVAELEAE